MCDSGLSLPDGVQRVARLLQEQGHPHAPLMLGAALGQIAKSITFFRQADDVIDHELFRSDEIWAAAGHPHGVFRLRPQDLERLAGAPVADLVQAPAAA